MPRQVTPGSSFWARLRGDPLVGNGSGDDASNSLAFEQYNRDIGLLGEAAATADTGGFSLLSFVQRLLQRITLVYKDVSGIGTAVKVAIVEGGSARRVNTTSSYSGISTGLSSSQQLYAASANPKIIYNNTTATVFVRYGATAAAVTTATYELPPGTSITDDFAGAAQVICGAGATGTISVTELLE